MGIRIDDNTQPTASFLSPSDMPSSGVGYSAQPTVGVRARPQFGPPIPPGGIQTPQFDFSAFDNMDPRQDPAGPSGPLPTQGRAGGGNPFLGFLANLFSRGVGGGATPQGMTGLLARGQGAPGTNNLGNPFNRFG
jgi:hypothetical protein